MKPIPIDPPQFAVSLAVLPALLLAPSSLLRAPALRTRPRALQQSLQTRMLNDIPAQLRWRVFERDACTRQRCGSGSDLLLDFWGNPPDAGIVRLSELTTRCVRCTAFNRCWAMMDQIALPDD